MFPHLFRFLLYWVMFYSFCSINFLLLFISKYFTFSDAIVNGTVFLNFIFRLSVASVQTYIEFCLLSLYLATLLNSFISAHGFLGEFLRIFYVKCHVNKERIVLHQSECIFFFPNILARTSITKLNRNGENKHPFLFHGFVGKVSRLSPLTVMLTIGFSSMPFIRFPSVPPNLFSTFIMKMCWVLSNAFYILI